MLTGATALVGAADKPNIILIVTDDQGYGEIGAHGNPVIETPHLDRLHAESVRFEDFHVYPMCTPTRGSLLTGLHPFRHKASGVSAGRAILRPDVPTLPEVLRDEGYATGMFGKWHLGDTYPHRPEDRGFDMALTFPCGYIGSLPDYWENDYFDDVYLRNGRREQFEGYTTDVFFDEAMDWIAEETKTGKPFFLYLPTAAPHWPYNAPPEAVERVRKRFDAVADQLPPEALKAKEGIIRYLAMIENIDWNIGRLEAFLEKEGLRDNTILIFSSDNGTTFGHLYFDAGMRGHKSQVWEGGHRVPLFVRWPGGGLREPDRVEGLTRAEDLMPTLLELLGIRTEDKFDGISLAPVLRESAEVPEDRMHVINYSRMSYFNNERYTDDNPAIPHKDGAVVLWKDWRWVENRELYNLADDPMQMRDVAAEHPEVVEKLKRHAEDHWSELGGTAGSFVPLVVGEDEENPVRLAAPDWANLSLDRQDFLRQGNFRSAPWNLEVAKAGTYRLEFRRFPDESGLGLTDSVPPVKLTVSELPGGPAKPITGVEFSLNGAKTIQAAAEAGAEAVSAVVELPAGRQTLQGWFVGKNGRRLGGTPFVWITRIEDSAQTADNESER